MIVGNDWLSQSKSKRRFSDENRELIKSQTEKRTHFNSKQAREAGGGIRKMIQTYKDNVLFQAGDGLYSPTAVTGPPRSFVNLNELRLEFIELVP